MSYAARAVLVLISAVYSLLSLHACSSQSAQEQVLLPQTVSLPQSTAVNILQSREEISLALQQAIDLYCEDNPQAQITVQTVSGKTDYHMALRGKLLAGEQVDVFHLSGSREMLNLQPYLEDLSGVEWIGDAAPGTLDAVTLGYSVYGTPYNLEGLGLIANRDIFSAAGISLSGLDSVEMLTEAMAELQAQIDTGELAEEYPRLEAVTELPALDGGFLGDCLAGVLLGGLFDSSLQAAQSPRLEWAEPEEGEAFVRLLARYGYAPDWADYSQISRGEQLQGLAEGRIAIILDQVSCREALHAISPDLENSLALLPVPWGEESAAVYAGPTLYWGVNAGSSPQVKDTGLDFLQWLYRSEAGAELVSERFGGLSPFPGTGDASAPLPPLYRQLTRRVDDGGVLPLLHQEFPAGWGRESFSEQIRLYLSKEIDWETAVERMQRSWAG